MGLRVVHHEVKPAGTLLDTEVTPFRLRHQMGFGYLTGDVGWQDDMPVLIDVIIIPFRVLNLIHRHVASFFLSAVYSEKENVQICRIRMKITIIFHYIVS